MNHSFYCSSSTANNLGSKLFFVHKNMVWKDANHADLTSEKSVETEWLTQSFEGTQMYLSISFGISGILMFSLCDFCMSQISAASREENNAICPQTTILSNFSYKNTFIVFSGRISICGPCKAVMYL